jgi:hypothetical protein
MTIEIEVPLRTFTNLFESDGYQSREVPGGATIRRLRVAAPPIGTGQTLKSHRTTDAEPLIPIMVEVGREVVIGLFVAWLYDKLKGNDGSRRKTIRINRVEVECTPETITRVIQESIEIDERK